MGDRVTVQCTWTPELRSDGFYLTERLGDSLMCSIFGPMPPEIVEPLVAERRALIEAIVRGARCTDADTLSRVLISR